MLVIPGLGRLGSLYGNCEFNKGPHVVGKLLKDEGAPELEMMLLPVELASPPLDEIATAEPCFSSESILKPNPCVFPKGEAIGGKNGAEFR